MCQPGAPESGKPGRVGTKQGSRGPGAPGRTQAEEARAELPASRPRLRGGGRKRRTRGAAAAGAPLPGSAASGVRGPAPLPRYGGAASAGEGPPRSRAPGGSRTCALPTWSGSPASGALRRAGAVLARCPHPACRRRWAGAAAGPQAGRQGRRALRAGGLG